ncbi:MAG: outer membrane protein transport protein [Saprospiraceae bacterium]
MKHVILFAFLAWSAQLGAQTGHVLQGSGPVNFSMGGAATAMPLDVTGALQWNPATITAFRKTEIAASAAYFTATPSVYSRANLPDGQGGFFPVEGLTKDERGASVLPTLAVVFGRENSKFAWGISALGVSGFGVDYPMTTNLPGNPDFDPTSSNPLLYPQNFMGFGHLYSDYQLLQVGLTGAYQIAEGLSIGLSPTFNYASLQIEPVPIAAPDQQRGYPIGEKASTTGFGGQVGVYYAMDNGFQLGVSYKTTQFFGDFEIDGKYLDGSEAPVTTFNMDYPSILSVGLGYSNDLLDVAVDYRYIDYANTDGFAKTGWVIAENGFPNGAVAGFGWESIHVIAAGIQYKGIEKLPIRVGYTFNTNPITEDNVFLSSSAPAVIANAAQLGLSYQINEHWGLHATYHHGFKTEVSGQLLNPMMIAADNPLGKVPGTTMTSDMTTDVGLLGVSYQF